MSLHNSQEKINPVKDREGSQRPSVFNGVKQFIESEKGKDILVVVIVILVGIGSFELGRLSKKNSQKGLKIEYTNPITGKTANVLSAFINSENRAPAENNTNNSGKNFFASSKGSKYYSLGCSAGKTIKQENRVYFTTGEEAQAAGYTLSTSCR
ncbi:MAG: Ada metal-binding domain-containing protein [Candidatus Pacebacteria bacterium]|nr:Ada metal-binding domain-containing protein [Candidatus Paceibacterota bacterium]